MGNANPIRTLGDYSKPSHEGYRNAIELPEWNNVSEDPNQHLKDFLKLVDSLDLYVANRERTRMHLFQFSLRDQARNWLERLPAGSISTWEDLTTYFLAQFFPSGRTAKLFQIFYDYVNPAIKRTIDQSAGGKLHDRNAKESRALLEDIALYNNESWNDPRDFAKPVKVISLPQDVPSTSDRRLIELKNQVQRLMEAHLAPKQPIQVNKITSSCEICNGPHDTQYCMENLEQAFVDYASSLTDEAGGLVSNFMASQDARLSKFKANFKQQQSEMTNKIDTVLKAITDRMVGVLPSDTVKNLKLNVNSTSPVLSARSYPTVDPQCSTQIYGSINTITICPKRPGASQTSKLREEEQDEKDNPENINTNPSSPPVPSVSFITEKNDDSHKEKPKVGENARVGELEMEYFDVIFDEKKLGSS
ncbi:MAK10-like protein [Tanacetum coccineum]